MTGLLGYYDRDGNPISVEEYSRLHGDPAYKRIASTQMGNLWISTVWLGADHSFSDKTKPLIFETMVFRKGGENPDMGGDVYSDRYSTYAEAVQGHRIVCRAVEDGRLDELDNYYEY